jgi:copper transport protein
MSFIYRNRLMRRAPQRALPLVLLMLLLGASAPARAFAHASLVSAVPAPNSRLADSPPAIALTFNERLDDGLYYIKLFDAEGRAVETKPAVMTADHTGIRLDVPKLQPGAYLVTYHVISADGHPVGGSYPLAVGPAGSGGTTFTSPPVVPGGHQHGLSGGIGVAEAGRYLARGIYYATLLAAAGWALWFGTARGSGAGAGDAAAAWRSWTTNTIRAHIVALLLLVATHAPDYVGEGGWDETVRLFTSTAVGLNWLVSLGLAAAGLAVVGRRRWLDAAWALALLLAKSFSGHAMAASAQPLPVVLDYAHLIAAAVWVGGMWTMLAKLRLDRAGFMPLLRRFSGAALLSILALAVTGAVTTLLYVRHVTYLVYTDWGYVLLAKVALVLAVVVTAALLRRRLGTDDPAKLKRPLTADAALMAAILLAVGVLTYLPPKPANEPLYWHEMGDKLHVTATIAPNVPGTDNTFTVSVWLPKEAGDPKQVGVRLVSEDRPEVAPIDIPVTLYEKTGDDPTYGPMQKFSYRAQGPYLPFAGQWKLTVTVRDANDDESQTEKAFRVF